jgi:hypothetical protein
MTCCTNAYNQPQSLEMTIVVDIICTAYPHLRRDRKQMQKLEYKIQILINICPYYYKCSAGVTLIGVN